MHNVMQSDDNIAFCTFLCPPYVFKTKRNMQIYVRSAPYVKKLKLFQFAYSGALFVIRQALYAATLWATTLWATTLWATTLWATTLWATSPVHGDQNFHCPTEI